ncbi:probable transcription factor At5g28040 [Zingiber officinale]|uniref:Glabrous enhancer-binding protein-like DBD domain-containing protein n=1 Tax=Zingiber officinale TaxID=94328 RepID=A0A8J5HS22_ZINOF|nr:probable transcription factor At5g28040 [Zingiber officinale]XP_042461605.1 probable transcription factor At5g28040 [Zingiber officinale]KAG6523684.1 hypothetical protein ZIOFF_013560 [Zingiber officinale]KAG6527521.1 hypothetical protein ZIOFF_009632 [Zingiber officinale]
MASSAEGDKGRAAGEAPEGSNLRKEASPERSLMVSVAGGEESTRRGFQKLWTDADEIAVLQGFWEFTSRRGTARADYQHDTGPFYEEIRGRLRCDFSRSQLVEKLRRLKKKFRSTAGRMAADKGFAFRSPHEEVAFEIARKIWNPVFKRGRDAKSGDLERGDALKDGSLDSDPDFEPRPRGRLKKGKETVAAAAAAVTAEIVEEAAASEVVRPSMPNSDMVEQTLRSCFSPLFNEILCTTGIGITVSNSPPLNPKPLNSRAAAAPAPALAGDRWKHQQILELEVYLKRLDLVHEYIKLKLEELKSQGSC